MAQGISLPFIVFATFVVNLRHALYAASLAPFMRSLGQRWLAPLGFALTDETYAVVIRRFHSEGQIKQGQWYYLGSALPFYLNWQLCTLVGIIAGTQLGDASAWGLDFAMTVTFIGIVVPLVKTRPMLACALVAAGGISGDIRLAQPAGPADRRAGRHSGRNLQRMGGIQEA